MGGRFLGRSGGNCLRALIENPSIFYSLSSSTVARSSRFSSKNIVNQYSKSHCRSSYSYRSFNGSEHGYCFSSSPSYSVRNGLVNWYLSMIESRPVLTKSITAGIIFFVADISSQMITDVDSLDFTRTSRMAAYGIIFSGPSLHFWFNFISRILPKRDVLTTLKKMFLGQTVYGPIMTSLFFSLNAALKGENGTEIIARLKRDLLPTLKSGVIYWPVCDYITFKFIPVRLQPLVSNSFSFLWTIYITYMASLKKAEVDQIK